MEQRLADHAADGVDAELIFPNRGLLSWATPDPVFALAMCRQWNRSTHAFCGPHMQGSHPRMLPAALIAPGDMAGAMAEIAWAKDHGFRAVCLSNSVIYGPKQFGELEYNNPSFAPMWSLLEDTGLVICFHVSTGRDPRAVGGAGGAIINYACHSMETTIEPLVQMIASGVFERHPKLHAGLVESGVGFVPWLLETLDHAARAHHFWVRPQLKELPSAYFRAPLLRHLPGRSGGLGDGRALRPHRQLPLGQRLPPPRGLLAALRRGHRAQHGRRLRRESARRSWA